MVGLIFNIQRFCVHDGPGIRTTVFFKGCPLHCVWCHNPEGLLFSHQIFYNREKCRSCRACEEVCSMGCHVFENNLHHFQREKCTGCQRCIIACPYGALENCGYREDTETIFNKILRDRDFYEESGGGITLSGGEPLMQPDLALELLKRARQNHIHCTVESSGYADKKTVQRVCREADLMLIDWKHSDKEALKKYTGASIEIINETLDQLADMNKPVWLRCPLIPGVNNTESHFEHIAVLCRKYSNIREVHIMPYHTLGSEKYARLYEQRNGVVYPVPEEKEILFWIKQISDKLPEIPVKRG